MEAMKFIMLSCNDVSKNKTRKSFRKADISKIPEIPDRNDSDDRFHELTYFLQELLEVQ